MCGMAPYLEMLKEEERVAKLRSRDGHPAIIKPQPILRMTQGCFLDIMNELLQRPPEAGGMLLGPEDDELVTHYEPDENAKATSASFTLDAVGLNETLARFRGCRMNCKGLVHSHPRGCTSPSGGDLEYVRKSLDNPKNQAATQFLLPIVCDGRLFPYIVRRHESTEVVLAELVLV